MCSASRFASAPFFFADSLSSADRSESRCMAEMMFSALEAFGFSGMDSFRVGGL